MTELLLIVVAVAVSAASLLWHLLVDPELVLSMLDRGALTDVPVGGSDQRPLRALSVLLGVVVFALAGVVGAGGVMLWM